MRYAVILGGRVVNVILWDGATDWNPGDDYTVIDCPDEVAIGWYWDNGFSEDQP